MADRIQNFTSTINAGVTQGGRRPAGQAANQRTESVRKKPFKAEENFIPSNDSLSSLIKNALLAMKEGTYWDRGSMLNLVV